MYFLSSQVTEDNNSEWNESENDGHDYSDGSHSQPGKLSKTVVY